MKAKRKSGPGYNRALRPAAPVSAGFEEIVNWNHPLVRILAARMPRAQALLAAWRADQGYRWFFRREDLDGLLAKVDRQTIVQGLNLGRTFLSGAPELPTTGERIRKLGLDPKSRISRKRNAVLINWHAHGEADNVEFIYMVNRQRYLIDMAMAARLGNRSDIAERVFEIMDHWIANCPYPDFPLAEKRAYWRKFGKTPWHELDVGLRLQSWLEALHILWDSPSLTPERFARYVRSMRQHALVLSRTTAWRPRSAYGNHMIMETQGLMYWSMLPWMKETAEARAVGMHNWLRCVYKQVLPDGGHCQRTPTYHLGSALWLAMPALLWRLNGWPVDPEADRRLRAMVRFAVHMDMPDRFLANFGNSGMIESGPTLAILARLTGLTLPWKPALTGIHRIYGAASGTRAARTAWRPVEWFPHAGYLCARSGWGRKANAVVMHVTGYGGGHGHSDWLSFIYVLRGRRLIADRGVNTYDLDAENLAFRKGRAHNILQIGERDAIFHQLNMWDKYVNAWPRMISFKPGRNGSADWLAEIRYLDGTTWRRRVRFEAGSGKLILEDAFRSPREDFTELRFHLNTTRARMTGPRECVTGDRGKPNVRIRVEGPAGMTDGLTPEGLSPTFWKRERGLLLCFKCRPSPPAQWRTSIEYAPPAAGRGHGREGGRC